MNLKIVFVSLLIIMTFILVSCSNNANSLELKLIGVAKEYTDIFYNNFEIVTEGYNNLMYNKPDELPQIVKNYTPNLTNAQLYYDAEENIAEFIYQYKPNQNDLVLSSDKDITIRSKKIMAVKLVSYNFIGQSISYFFDAVKMDLKDKGIHFEKPSILITYAVDKDYYMVTRLVSQFQLEYYIVLPNENPYNFFGGFASGSLIAGIDKPVKYANGKYSPEISLLKFFKRD